MLKDVQNLEVATDSPEAIAAINHFIEQALSYGCDAETAILQSIAADPACSIAHAYAAAYYLSQENWLDRKRALPHLSIAQQQMQRASQREQLYIQAIAAWAEGTIARAIAYHEAIAQQFPQDLISVQQGQYHYFYRGDRECLLAIAQAVLPANPENCWLYSMIAFGLEQCHLLPAAEQMGRQATQLQRHNPWAHHAVAHVMETQGRTAEGIAWMESLSETWTQCNSMLYTHNWWHIALFYLAQGEMRTVLKLYDRQIWGRAIKSAPKDQVGAISLLLRLELKGVRVGRRWQNLSPYLQPRVEEHALPFQDLHYIYALVRAKQFELAKTMLHSMSDHAQSLEPSWRQAWEEVAIPAARGMVAHANKNWAGAIAHLKPVLPQLYRIGGSHAQRVLFQQIYQDALLKTHQRNSFIQISPWLVTKSS